jgi:ABC-type nitrate/sulfonate/bicarbonate transport system permease component
MLFDIVLPAATPYLLAGLRLAAGRALIGAVVAEFFLAIPGLGYFILYNSRTFHQNEAFVAVIFLSGFGVGFNMLVNAATRRFLPWYRRNET